MSNPNESPIIDLASFDTIVDLVGNPFTADLTLFLNGNQFMVMDDLLKAFREEYPTFSNIYYETLPPGILLQQIQAGGNLQIGALHLSVKPDIYTAGKSEMEQLAPSLLAPMPYAENHLALLVPEGNPKNVKGFPDLSDASLRIAMPNPATEGIARLAKEAIRRAAGESAVNEVFQIKLHNGTTRLTTVHHRETVAWLNDHQVDVGVVWKSEAMYAIRQGHPLMMVSLEHFKENPMGQYWVAGVKDAPHPEARDAFLRFLPSKMASEIYSAYGFSPLSHTSSSFAGF